MAQERIGFGRAQYSVILVCGLCFMSDSIEIGMLSFLQSKATDEFDLDSFREALLSSVVFVGELLGALTFGPLADRCVIDAHPPPPHAHNQRCGHEHCCILSIHLRECISSCRQEHSL